MMAKSEKAFRRAALLRSKIEKKVLDGVSKFKLQIVCSHFSYTIGKIHTSLIYLFRLLL